MYAAVAAGHKGFMVSNDEMRDHIFQMLAPRYFHKWKQRHQVSKPRLQQPSCVGLVHVMLGAETSSGLSLTASQMCSVISQAGADLRPA